ncbi:MAG: hypothetical protein ACJAZS_000140 [Alteromonas naphthalenivorans]|jgi:hypothetical protein
MCRSYYFLLFFLFQSDYLSATGNSGFLSLFQPLIQVFESNGQGLETEELMCYKVLISEFEENETYLAEIKAGLRTVRKSSKVSLLNRTQSNGNAAINLKIFLSQTYIDFRKLSHDEVVARLKKGELTPRTYIWMGPRYQHILTLVPRLVTRRYLIDVGASEDDDAILELNGKLSNKQTCSDFLCANIRNKTT